MTKLKYFSVFFSLFHVHLLHEVQGVGELDNFLKEKISHYGDWLQLGNHDPSPASEELNVIRDNNEFITIICELSNRFAVGHSRDVTILEDLVESDLIKENFHFYINYGINVTFKGNFTGIGTVVDNPMSGEGHWFISYDAAYQFVYLSGFSITSDGFIDLSTASFTSYLGIFENTNVTSYFEGLYEDVPSEYKDLLSRMLEEEFRYLLTDYNLDHPLSPLIRTYLQEVFDKTPLSEIIGTTMPPTTAEPPTTCAPCNCEDYKSPFTHPQETFVKERILGKDVETGEDGERYIVTTKLVTVKSKERE